jgi:hypothetical protein
MQLLQIAQYKGIMGATPAAKPLVNKPHTATVQGHVEKAAPGKDIFADHPHIEIKSDSRPPPPPPQAVPKDPAAIPAENVQVNENAPPVGEPQTEAKKAPEVVKTAGQPGAPAPKKEETVAAKAAGGEKAPVVEVPKQEVKKDASTTAPALAKEVTPAPPKAEAALAAAVQPLLEDDIEADRVAKQLYDADH